MGETWTAPQAGWYRLPESIEPEWERLPESIEWGPLESFGDGPLVFTADPAKLLKPPTVTAISFDTEPIEQP